MIGGKQYRDAECKATKSLSKRLVDEDRLRPAIDD